MALSTDVAIRKWRPSQDGESQSTGGRAGLYVRGWPSGRKSFYYRFKGKTWLKIGDHPETTLAAARELSLVARRLAGEGFPAEMLRRGFANSKAAGELEMIVKGERLAGLATIGTPHAPTYDQIWRQWYDARAPFLQEGPSRRRPLAIHERYIRPVLGDRPITDIRRREIFDLLEPLFAEKPVTAAHALGHIRAVFERAANRELVEADPTPRRSAFADVAGKRKVRHHGTIDPARLPALWQFIQGTEASPAARAAILTLLVTAHRVGVVVNAEWAHIDAASGIWTVPERADKMTPGRMKSGREYVLKLPSGLIDRLLELRDDETAQYVFESPVTKGPISGNAILKTLKRFEPSLTAHGFRNAIKVWARRADPPVDPFIADAYCDHSLKGLDAAYRREGTDTERAALAERLYAFVIGGQG